MKKLFVLVLMIAFVACQKNPITGKSPLNLMGKGIYPTAFAQYQEVLGESSVIKNTSEAQMIKNVGLNIQTAVEEYLTDMGESDFLQGYEWEYNLIESDQINAWCMPGGKVAFYTGILPICQDENGVAVVMGHEITHALAEHGGQRMSQAMLAQLGMVAGNIATMKKEQQNALFNQLYPIGSQVAILSYSRKHELEADKIGLEIMARAGYDPREAPKFWQRMEAATSGGQRPPEFLSTHPNPSKRIEQLEAMIPQVMPIYESHRRK